MESPRRPNAENGLEDELIGVALLHDGSGQVSYYLVSLLECLDLPVEVASKDPRIDLELWRALQDCPRQ